MKKLILVLLTLTLLLPMSCTPKDVVPGNTINALSADDYDRVITDVNQLAPSKPEIKETPYTNAGQWVSPEDEPWVDIEKEAATHIKKFEKFSKRAYREPNGRYSIGYGFNKKHFKGRTISKYESNRFLKKKVKEISKHIDAKVKVVLTPYQKIALISFVYNIGYTQFDNSTMLKQINNGNLDLAAKQFTRWVKAKKKILPGLVIRRNFEKKLFTYC